jgi:hypothetical protein
MLISANFFVTDLRRIRCAANGDGFLGCSRKGCNSLQRNAVARCFCRFASSPACL